MNREHKYRIWDYDNRGFDYIDLFKLGPTITTLYSVENYFHSTYLNDHKEFIQQYTGLNDKNGVDIYEGDILSIDNKDFTYEVKFENGCFVAYHLLKKYLGIWGPVYKFDEKGLEIEVIGNIHENPELLNKKS